MNGQDVSGAQFIKLLATHISKFGENILTGELPFVLNPDCLQYLNGRLVNFQENGDASCRENNDAEEVRVIDRFLRKVPGLQIAPVGKDGRVPSGVHLKLFHSLGSLELKNVRAFLVKDWNVIHVQIRTLSLRASVNTLDEILVDAVQKRDDAPVEEDTARPPENVIWPRLRELKCTHAKLTSITPTAIAAIPFVEMLDLSNNNLVSLNNLEGCAYLSVLNLSFNSVADLSRVNHNLGQVKNISLRSNGISSIRGLEKLYALEVLDLSNNIIASIDQVRLLTALPLLTALWLDGNPLSFLPKYRTETLSLFVSARAPLTQLDGETFSAKDVEVVAQVASAAFDEAPVTAPDAYATVAKPDVDAKKRAKTRVANIGLDGRPQVESREADIVSPDRTRTDTITSTKPARTETMTKAAVVPVPIADASPTVPPAPQSAPPPLERVSSQTSMRGTEIQDSAAFQEKIEKLRNEGGTKWLSVLSNTDPSNKSSDPIVAEPTKKKKVKKAAKKKAKAAASTDKTAAAAGDDEGDEETPADPVRAALMGTDDKGISVVTTMRVVERVRPGAKDTAAAGGDPAAELNTTSTSVDGAGNSAPAEDGSVSARSMEASGAPGNQLNVSQTEMPAPAADNASGEPLDSARRTDSTSPSFIAGASPPFRPLEQPSPPAPKPAPAPFVAPIAAAPTAPLRTPPTQPVAPPVAAKPPPAAPSFNSFPSGPLGGAPPPLLSGTESSYEEEVAEYLVDDSDRVVKVRVTFLEEHLTASGALDATRYFKNLVRVQRLKNSSGGKILRLDFRSHSNNKTVDYLMDNDDDWNALYTLLEPRVNVEAATTVQCMSCSEIFRHVPSAELKQCPKCNSQFLVDVQPAAAPASAASSAAALPATTTTAAAAVPSPAMPAAAKPDPTPVQEPAVAAAKLNTSLSEIRASPEPVVPAASKVVEVLPPPPPKKSDAVNHAETTLDNNLRGHFGLKVYKSDSEQPFFFAPCSFVKYGTTVRDEKIGFVIMTNSWIYFLTRKEGKGSDALNGFVYTTVDSVQTKQISRLVQGFFFQSFRLEYAGGMYTCLIRGGASRLHDLLDVLPRNTAKFASDFSVISDSVNTLERFFRQAADELDKPPERVDVRIYMLCFELTITSTFKAAPTAAVGPVQPRTLAMSSTWIYLCEEDYVNWPYPSSKAAKPPATPHYQLNDKHSVWDIAGIEIHPNCQFIVSFKDDEDRDTGSWTLCATLPEEITRFTEAVRKLHVAHFQVSAVNIRTVGV